MIEAPNEVARMLVVYIAWIVIAGFLIAGATTAATMIHRTRRARFEHRHGFAAWTNEANDHARRARRRRAG